MTRSGLFFRTIAFLACLAPFHVEGKMDTDKLDQYLQGLVDHDRMMLSIEMTRGGDVVYQFQGGFASVEDERPLTAGSRFRIGSITKTFTAVLVLQLVEQGRLDLETPLSDYFPDIPNADGITLGQMLRHRSGIANFTNAPEYREYMTAPQTRQRLVERIAALDPEFEPGEKYGYSNSNYVLLGAIIEDVLEADYASVLAERITGPLGLEATYYGGEIDPARSEVFSYRWMEGAWTRAEETDMSIPGGAGAIVSTPGDLNRFYEALFAGRLVSEPSLEQMKSLQDNYGYGLIAFPFYSHRFLGHNGGIDGFVSTAALNVEDGTAIAVLSNGQNYNFNDVLVAALSAVYGRDFEVPDFTAGPVELETGQLEPLTGSYVSDEVPLDIRVFMEGSQLMAQATGQGAFPLTPFSENEFRFEQAGIVMVFDRAGEPVSFTLHQAGGKFAFRRDGD